MICNHGFAAGPHAGERVNAKADDGERRPASASLRRMRISNGSGGLRPFRTWPPGPLFGGPFPFRRRSADIVRNRLDAFHGGVGPAADVAGLNTERVRRGCGRRELAESGEQRLGVLVQRPSYGIINPVATVAAAVVDSIVFLGAIATYPIYCFPYGSCPVYYPYSRPY